MDAPQYPAATVYEEPTLIAGQTRIDRVTVGELLEAPATRAVLLSEPALAALLADPSFRPHLYNLTLADLAGMVRAVTPEVLARLDGDLRAIPADAWPVL
jgi:hypothetical protein